MFVRVMNHEEREKFLELIYKIANIDGDYASEEEEIINNYKTELQLEAINDTDSIDGLITYFAGKQDTLKRIVVFEIYGIIKADNKIEESEEQVLKSVKIIFGLPEVEIGRIFDVADELQDVYDRVYDVLFA